MHNKQWFRKGMAGVLAALMLTQSVSLTAFAAEYTEDVAAVQAEVMAEPQLQNGTAMIPSDATKDEVKEILFDALVVNKDGLNAQDLDWEYYCEGTEVTALGTPGLRKNDAWGSIVGFESETVEIIKIPFVGNKEIVTTYTHPALSDNNDGNYQVRLAGTTAEVTLTKAAKGSASIILNEGISLSLPHKDNGDVDYGALEAKIFEAVVKTTTPELTADDVTIEYWATSSLGTKSDWSILEGETKDVIYKYPAISTGDQQIRVSYAGNDTYFSTSAETTIHINEPASSNIALKEGCVVNMKGLTLDQVRQKILETVVEENEYGLTTDNTTIEYYATAVSGSLGSAGKAWMPLEGGKKDLLTYPAISEGNQRIRVTFKGSDDYQDSTSNEVMVNFVTKDFSTVEVNEGAYSVALPYKDDTTVDYDTLEEKIFEAVVKSTMPTELGLEDVTIEYYATYQLFSQSNEISANAIGQEWVPLSGKEETLGRYPAISEGAQQIRISWAGNDDYYGFEKEVQVTITGRPEAPYILKETPGSVKLTVKEDMSTDYDALRTAIFNAVVASSDILTANNVTITYYTKALTDADAKYVALEGEKGTILAWPAISAGEQKIRISWPGNQQYAPTTIEATVTVTDRDQVQFNLNEGPYEVGMVFTDDQGYDYDATAAAIYNAVVASTVNPKGLTADDVTVEYNVDKTGITDSFKPLSETDLTGLVKFKDGEWEIRISWAGSKEYKGGSVTVNVTTTDSRLESAVALKDGVSFTYNMDVSAMEQAIFDNVIDWENSALPAKETLSIDDFTIEYKAALTDAETGMDVDLDDLKDVISKVPVLGNLVSSDSLKQWVPIEGKVYNIGNTVLGQFPQMGAGEQQIRISYKGNADYRPSENVEGTVTVNKAKVTVKVNSTNIYADEDLPANFITTDPADKFDIYTIYAGITSNVTTGIYLDLPERYTDSAIIKLLDPVVQGIYGKSFTQMLNDGVTVGELRELFSTQELLDLLYKLNIDTGTFGQIMTVINKMPGILDSVRISFGTPNRAGLYTVAVVTDNKNYETGVGMGFLLVKMHLSGAHLTWNAEIPNGKLTAEEAKTFDFGATLSYDGDVSVDQGSVHYLYSGFTSKWKIYSSTTTPPTEPGRYVVTVCILGGNYLAAPITRSFQITK